jgi:hypothetical protein
MTEGGDYNPMSDKEIREKVSIKMRGVKRGEKWCENISKSKKNISIHTEDSKKKISDKTKGQNNPMFGKKHTKDAINKMSKKITQMTLNGEIIKEWNSAAEIERVTNKKWLARSINRCAHGDRKTAYGYKWVYKDKGRI